MKKFIKWHKELTNRFSKKIGIDSYQLAWVSWFKGLITGIILMILLSSCHITKDLDVVGGSKSDAIVEMTYEYHLFQKVTISSWEESQEKATNTCSSWGYTSAKRFETPKKDCIGWGKDGCYKWRVTWQYQCLE